MKLDVLISTMHQKDMSLIERMNIQSDALIINQYDFMLKVNIAEGENYIHKMISICDRGLSKSRNLAIYSSDADICVIADDDLVYVDNYPDIIKNAYFKYPEADIIAFAVPSTNKDRPTSKLKSGDIGFIKSMKICSFQITFKRKSIIDKKIKFNELFGAGARYTCGEENIWMSDCLKKGLKIRFENTQIAVVNHASSTWFHGYDLTYFKTKGAMFYAIDKNLWVPLVVQYAIRKYELYRNNLSFIDALKHMDAGRKEYIKLMVKQE